MRTAGKHRVDFPKINICRGRQTVAEQGIDTHAECVCDVDDGRQTQLCCAAFNVRDVGWLLIGKLGQRLLCQTQLFSIPADADANCGVIEFQFSSLPEFF